MEDPNLSASLLYPFHLLFSESLADWTFWIVRARTSSTTLFYRKTKKLLCVKEEKYFCLLFLIIQHRTQLTVKGSRWATCVWSIFLPPRASSIACSVINAHRMDICRGIKWINILSSGESLSSIITENPDHIHYSQSSGFFFLNLFLTFLTSHPEL